VSREGCKALTSVIGMADQTERAKLLAVDDIDVTFAASNPVDRAWFKHIVDNQVRTPPAPNQPPTNQPNKQKQTNKQTKTTKRDPRAAPLSAHGLLRLAPSESRQPLSRVLT